MAFCSATRNRFTPREKLRVHTKIKASIEFQIMPGKLSATWLPARYPSGPFDQCSDCRAGICSLTRHAGSSLS